MLRFYQLAFYELLKGFVEEKGYVPTYETLMEITGYKSKMSIVKLMHSLLDNGYISAEVCPTGRIRMNTIRFNR